MRKNIERAIKILSPLASKYKERQDANYIAYYNTDERLAVFEPLQNETYCEDCVELAARYGGGGHFNAAGFTVKDLPF